MSAERTLFQRPFETAFRWLVLTIVLWSFGALAATDQLPPALTLGGFPLILAAWIGEKRFPLSRWLWLVLIVAFLAFDAWIFLDVGRIDAVVYLPIFLLINKLWSPKKARDIVQILVICFFFMVSAAVMTARISFLFLFVVYLFLMLVGLVFLTVRREHEALAALGLDRRSGVDPKEIVPAGFYARAWGAVACTLFLTVWIFALFPRFSTNSLFFPMARGFTREGRMGYGREIQLGNLSSIAPDSTAVLRLQLEDPRRPGERPMNGVYLRGSVVERFNGASWTEAPEAHESRRSEGWKFQFTPRGQAIGGPLREIQQTVFMDPGAEKDLFLLENAATVSFNWNHQLSLWMDDPANTCSLARARDEVLSYQAISWVRPPDAGDPEAASAASGAAPLRSARQRLPSERAYLQLSPMERAPEIRALAETIVKDAGARTRYEQAAAVERYLRTRYSYDLQNLDYDRIHPTEAFLLDQRRGHCEHFASGMAVLLRLLNVPCRIVNGFYTNRWNKFMNFFLVEQSDAHTWVEVYFPTGWVAFDPTPPDSIVRAPAENPLLREVSAWIDALRMQWYLHVIDYDLNHQERLIQSLGSRSPHAISDLLRWGFHTAFWVDRGGVRYTAVRSARAIVLGLAAGAAVFLALTAGGFVARRKRARAAGDTALRWTRIRMYEQILRALARRGLPRPAAATALEFAGVVEARRPDLSGFLALTRRYYEARFAEAALTAEDEAAFRQCLRQARTKPRRA